MKTAMTRTVLLSTLLLLPSATRLRAQSDPPTPPSPPPPPAAAPAPPPEAPAPPAPPARHRKRVIVATPEHGKEIVVDGDRVFVWNDGDGPEAFADLDGLEAMQLEGPQTSLRHANMGGGFIGVRPIEMTPELRQHFGAPKDAGILVGSVEPDGPAAKAGVKVGDIVTRVDGERIDSVHELVSAVRHKKDGEKVAVELLRDRSAKSLTIVVVERKGKEIRVGALEDGMPGMRWKTRAPRAMLAPLPSDMSDLQERLDEMDKRLRELEGRKPGQ